MDGVPGYVHGILMTLVSNGYEAYLVGGCLRDMLLGRTVHDWDIASSAPGAEVQRLFPKTVRIGDRFGTVTVVTGGGTAEVTTFRSESGYSDRRRPDSVTFVSDLQEDLKRRDFTVNAMAMGVDGTLTDPFGGRSDLRRGIIRCVGDPAERFSEDALRLFRALRFSAQLGFEIEEGTLSAIKSCSALCAWLSAERVRDETEKILLSDKPERVGEAVSYGLFKGRLESGEVSCEKLRHLSGLPGSAPLRWSAFCALLLEQSLIALPESFLKSMRLDTGTVRCCSGGVSLARKPLPEGRVQIKRLLAEFGEEAVLCAAAADKALRQTAALRAVKNVLESGECWSVRELAIGGDDLLALGFSQGVWLGKTLKALLEHVIEHPEDNVRARLYELARGMRG